MQRKLYTDFDLLFDSISAIALVRGYMVPIFQFVVGFTGSGLVLVGLYFHPFSCDVIDVLIKHILAWLTKGVYASNPSCAYN